MSTDQAPSAAARGSALTEGLGLVERLRQRRVTNWVHSTGTTPKADGTKPDPDCWKAAEEIESGNACIEALRGAVIAETARADGLHELAMQYAIVCGELSKALTPGDPLWLELRGLGERLDELA